MLVKPFEMWGAGRLVAVQNQLFELRHGNLESVFDPLQPRFERLSRRPRQLLQKISAEWIARFSHGSLRLAHELRDQVQVPDLREEISKGAKRGVGVQLFEMRLAGPLGVLFVFLAWPMQVA